MTLRVLVIKGNRRHLVVEPPIIKGRRSISINEDSTIAIVQPIGSPDIPDVHMAERPPSLNRRCASYDAGKEGKDRMKYHSSKTEDVAENDDIEHQRAGVMTPVISCSDSAETHSYLFRVG